MTNKSAFFPSVLILFLVVFSAFPSHARETAAQLHLPWALFEKELQNVMTQNGIPWRAQLPNSTLGVAGYNWNLAGVSVDAQVMTEPPIMDGSRLFVRATKMSMRLGVERISIDQVIEREVSGAIFRLHIRASCGPIRLIQEQAQAEGTLSLDWSSGLPVARLQNLGLAWNPGSWAVSEFSCEGPQGFDVLLHDEIVKRTKEPTEIKPLIANWLAAELQTRLQQSLLKLKNPLDLSTGEGKIPMRLGTMTPVNGGLLANVLFGEAVPGSATPSPVPPPNEFLEQLPKDAPILFGRLDVLEQLVQTEMKSRGEVTTVDLQSFASFRRIIQSRFLQFFFWQDLFNFAKDSPFFFRLKTPNDIRLSPGDDGSLTAKLPVQGVIQSKRDDRWWDYVTVIGQTQADIKLDLSEGVFKFQTSLQDPDVAIAYGAEYKKTYGTSGWLPTSSIRSAFKGPQPSLSGSKPWPDVDLGAVGRFRSSDLSWADPQTFVITWRKVQE